MESKRYKYMCFFLSIIVLIAAIAVGYNYSIAKTMKTTVENNYNRAFNELVGYVDDIDTLLQKSMLVSSPSQTATLSGELVRETAAAKACLAQLPQEEISLEKTEKFLSQTGDYTYILSQKSIYNEEITDDEYTNLEKLSDYASTLNKELLKMQDEIYSGKLSFGNNKNKYFGDRAEAAENILGFERIEKQFQEYPSLIYDGPFSEHIEKMNPVMTESKENITNEQALEILKNFLKKDIKNLENDGESKNTALESYLFKSDDIYAAVTKKGGYVLYFLENKEINEEKISVEDAIVKAENFLSERGYTSMKDSYYDTANGIATINFAFEQNGVICYSDLVKVKVALDNGEIIGFESKGYLMSHQEREITEVNITEDEVKSKINNHLYVEDIKKAIIPKDNKKEILCYEVRGKYKDKNFLIYINAANGREEEILMLIESENGILTV